MLVNIDSRQQNKRILACFFWICFCENRWLLLAAAKKKVHFSNHENKWPGSAKIPLLTPLSSFFVLKGQFSVEQRPLRRRKKQERPHTHLVMAFPPRVARLQCCCCCEETGPRRNQVDSRENQAVVLPLKDPRMPDRTGFMP